MLRKTTHLRFVASVGTGSRNMLLTRSSAKVLIDTIVQSIRPSIADVMTSALRVLHSVLGNAQQLGF
jgi:hypothetical protein